MPGSAARRTSLLGEVRLQQRAAERARLGVRGVCHSWLSRARSPWGSILLQPDGVKVLFFLRKWLIENEPTAPAEQAHTTRRLFFACYFSRGDGPRTEGADYAHFPLSCDTRRSPVDRIQ